MYAQVVKSSKRIRTISKKKKVGDKNAHQRFQRKRKRKEKKVNSLERIGGCLPLPSNLDFNLYTTVNLLLTALIVNPKLDNIPILERERSTFNIRIRQTNMIQKRP